MEVVGSLFGSQGGVVLTLLIGSFVVIKLLKLSSAVAVIAAGLPLALYQIDSPLITQLRTDYPTGALCGAWCSTAIVGLLWRGASPLWAGLAGDTGVLRQVYLAGMCVALIVVVALFVAPELLVQYAPGWRSTVGAILLGVSLVSVSRAIAQILKAGVLLVLWSGVALVLASQVFLQKMPYAIERSDVMRLEGFFTSETARGAFRDVFDVLKGRHALSKMFGALGPMLPEAQRVVTEAQPELLLRRAGLLGQRLNQVSTSEFSQNRQEMS